MFQDLRYSARMLLKHPGFTFVALLTLALDIGANTAIFSLIDAVLLKALPVKNPEQLVLFSHANSRMRSDDFSYSAYKQFLDHNQVFSGVLAYYPLRLTVSVDGQPETAVSGQLVTGNYYTTLGVNAALGRTIIPDDDSAIGKQPVCVISHSYWQQRFASDQAVVGRTIHLSGAPFTIIGVAPPEFFGLEVGSSLDISIPMTMQEQVTPGVRSFMQDNTDRFRVMGRLRSGTTIEQAQAGLRLLYQQFLADRFAFLSSSSKAKQPSQSMLEERLELAWGGKGLSELRRQFSQPLLVLMSVVDVLPLFLSARHEPGADDADRSDGGRPDAGCRSGTSRSAGA